MKTRAVLALAFACNVAAAGTAQTATLALSGRAMGTPWTVKIGRPPASVDASEVARRVRDRLEQLEQMFSTYRPDSDIARFNTAAQLDWIAVPSEMVEVAAESRRISAVTQGAFDATIFPLVELWGFAGQRRSDLPTPDEIAKQRDAVAWRRLEIRQHPPALRKMRPDLRVDFASMAKGFAADAISELLRSSGLPNHLVQIGGDLKAAGAGPEGNGWRVAIEQPLVEGRAIERVLLLCDQALSTSGDNRNFFQVNGRRYGHVLDPRTGWPTAHDLASVSVVDAACAISSARATALFVLGPVEGFRLAQANGWACLFLVGKDDARERRLTREFDELPSEPK